MRRILWEEVLLEQDFSKEQNNIMISLNSMSLESFSKIARKTYESSTFSDLELKVSDFISIEEYMDMFSDWAYGLTFEDIDEEIQNIIGTLNGLSLLKTLFLHYIKTEEYNDYLKELMDDPAVQDEIEQLSKESEIEYEEENLKNA